MLTRLLAPHRVLAAEPAAARLAEVGVAFVRVEPGRAVTADDVLAHCRGRIASFKIPRHVFIVDDFPMTSSGKIQKVKLREEGITPGTFDREAAGITIAR